MKTLTQQLFLRGLLHRLSGCLRVYIKSLMLAFEHAEKPPGLSRSGGFFVGQGGLAGGVSGITRFVPGSAELPLIGPFRTNLQDTLMSRFVPVEGPDDGAPGTFASRSPQCLYPPASQP